MAAKKPAPPRFGRRLQLAVERFVEGTTCPKPSCRLLEPAVRSKAANDPERS